MVHGPYQNFFRHSLTFSSQQTPSVFPPIQPSPSKFVQSETRVRAASINICSFYPTEPPTFTPKPLRHSSEYFPSYFKGEFDVTANKDLHKLMKLSQCYKISCQVCEHFSTFGRTPWVGDRPVARPQPMKTTQIFILKLSAFLCPQSRKRKCKESKLSNIIPQWFEFIHSLCCVLM